MYWIDRFAMEIVKEKDKSAPPERYYEYRKGVSNDIIIETYIKDYNPLQLVDFTRSITSKTLSDGRREVDVLRDSFFKENDTSLNSVLYAYTVPPKWYDQEISKLEDDNIKTRIEEDLQSIAQSIANDYSDNFSEDKEAQRQFMSDALDVIHRMCGKY